MRMGGSWAGLNPGNQNYLNALQSMPAYSSQVSPPPNAPAAAQPTGSAQASPPPEPVKAVAPLSRVPGSRPPMPSPTVQPGIAQKARMGSQFQPKAVGQTQNTMAPGGNSSAYGNTATRAFKKGGIVTTRKVATATKNKSQPKW